MKRYRCNKCETNFFKERANMNQKHSCGEYASFDWSFDGPADQTTSARSEAKKEQDNKG